MRAYCVATPLISVVLWASTQHVVPSVIALLYNKPQSCTNWTDLYLSVILLLEIFSKNKTILWITNINIAWRYKFSGFFYLVFVKLVGTRMKVYYVLCILRRRKATREICVIVPFRLYTGSEVCRIFLWCCNKFNIKAPPIVSNMSTIRSLNKDVKEENRGRVLVTWLRY